MTSIRADLVVGYLRREYRALVVDESAPRVDWRCPAWVAYSACQDGASPTRQMCAACPVQSECLLAALVVDDPEPIRAGLTRQERADMFSTLESIAALTEPWLNERSVDLNRRP